MIVAIQRVQFIFLKMRRSFLCFLLLSILLTAHAQHLLLTGFAGMSNYQGDLQDKKFTFSGAHVAGGIGLAYEVTDQFDIYGGVMLGYNIASESFSTTNPNNGVVQAYNDNSTSSSAVTFSLYGGARYMFNEHVGAFAELGYNIAYLSIGVSFKL